MPIRLTWTSPSQYVIGYVIYRRTGNGLINIDTDFYKNLPGNVLLFDDINYDRTILQTVGYTYGISALGPAGEGPLSLKRFIIKNFDEILFEEDWSFNISSSEEQQFLEQWEFSNLLSPSQLYIEEWEPSPLPSFNTVFLEDWEFVDDSIVTSELALWLDADNILGLSNGDPVDTWIDVGPNGNDFSQTGASRPEYITNVINGFPIVRFDGSVYMSSSDNDTFTADDGQITFFAVVSVNNSSNSQTILTSRPSGISGTQDGYNISLNSSGNFAFGTSLIEGATISIHFNATVNLEGSGFKLVTIYLNSSTLQVRINTSDVTTTLPAGTPPAGAIDGSTPHLGRGISPSSTSFFNGDIAEVILYTRALSSVEIDEIEDYLMTKYSL